MIDIRQAAQQALEFLMTRRMGAEAVIESLNEALAREHAMHELARLGQEIEQEPTGYWDGKFSKDGGATLYEVPQESMFGRKYPNIPLYATPPAAQPEQEPTCPKCKAAVLYECVACSSNNYPPVAQPEQEPVAWMYTSRLDGNQQYITRFQHDLTTYKADKVWPLYTTPPAAQPEQEPCIGKDPRCPCQDGDACHYKDCGNTKARPVAQPEPLEYWNAVEGWVKIDEVREHFNSVGCGTIYKAAGEDRVPLYTAAQRRPWQGLTDGEKKKIATAAGCTDDDDGHIVTEIFRLAEAKLKERNNGH